MKLPGFLFYQGVVKMNDRAKKIREIRRDFHPHTLRHTFATRCFENKMEPKVVQKLMGHSNISVTLNIYTHVLENTMDEEIKKFGTAMTDVHTLIPPDIKVPATITANSHY